MLDDIIKIIQAQCKQCGKCCYNRSIFLLPSDVKHIADYLKISYSDFILQYCEITTLPYLKKKIPALRLKHKENRACIFLNDNKCEIHKVKPYQCKIYPFILPTSTFLKCEADNIFYFPSLSILILERERRNIELMQHYKEVIENNITENNIIDYFLKKISEP